MSSGDIAVSRDFLYRLITAAVDAQLSEDRIRLVLDAVEENATSDRTLGVEDIATVMASLRNKVDGGNVPLDKDTGDGKMTPDDETILMDSLRESCGKRLKRMKTMTESVVVAINPTAEELRTIDKLRAQGVEVVVANSQEELDELMAQHGGVVANNSRGRMDDLTRGINRDNSPRGSRLRNQRDFVDAAVKARDIARGDQLDESFLGIAQIKPTVRVDSLEDEFGPEFHQMADENDIDEADIRAAKKAAGLKYW